MKDNSVELLITLSSYITKMLFLLIMFISIIKSGAKIKIIKNYKMIYQLIFNEIMDYLEIKNRNSVFLRILRLISRLKFLHYS